MPDTAPMTLDYLLAYAKSLDEGKPFEFAATTDWPDDIASILGQVQDARPLDKATEKALKDAYAEWEADGYPTPVVDYDDDEYLTEGSEPGGPQPVEDAGLFGDTDFEPTKPADPSQSDAAPAPEATPAPVEGTPPVA